MNYLKSKNFPYTLAIIFSSAILAILISNYNLKNYDKIVTDEYGSFHQMIKYDALRYLSHGAEIKKDLNEGVNFLKLVEKILPSIFHQELRH